MELNEFHLIVGETIMYCQYIEHNIKMIYAAMLKGTYVKNYAIVDKKSLGQVIVMLKELDNSDGKPMFKAKDYELLREITKKRNHWCHQAYVNFGYIEDPFHSQEFLKECEELKSDNEQIENLSMITETIRINLFKNLYLG